MPGGWTSTRRGRPSGSHPPASFAEDVGAEGRVTGIPVEDEEEVGEPEVDVVDFSIRGIPVRDFIASTRHYRELRREIRLLALAHQDDYPLAKNLSDLFSAMDQPARAQVGAQQIEAAYAAGEETTDLELTLPRRVVERVDLFIEMLDLADEFCRAERLLSVARTPDERAFQNWFLREFVRQAGGEEPRPWSAASGPRTARPVTRDAPASAAAAGGGGRWCRRGPAALLAG